MKYMTYREKRKHGTFEFPLEFYHVCPCHPRYQMSYHWHIEYEIVRILKGEFPIKINENEYNATAGDVIFIKGGFIHGGIPRDCVYECIVFNLDSFMSSSQTGKILIQKINSEAIEIEPLFPRNDTELARIISVIFENVKLRTEGYKLKVIGSFYELFGYILEKHLYSESQSCLLKNNRRIANLKNALKLIETSYAEPLTLDDLALAANMNPKYFCRYFREMTHRTPIDYLNYYRIEQASLKLATSNESITKIGLSCGFNDVSYFIKTFKKYKGITPKKYLSAPLS